MNTEIKNSHCAPTNRLWFDDFLTREVDRFFSHNKAKTSSVSPSANVWEDEKALHIELALPAIKKENVKIKMENNLLQISAESVQESENETKNFIRKEFGRVNYSRSFRLNQEAFQHDAVEATMNDAVLRITLPKRVKEQKENTQFIAIK
jgi:HSP20 family protein